MPRGPPRAREPRHWLGGTGMASGARERVGAESEPAAYRLRVDPPFTTHPCQDVTVEP